MKNKMKYKVLPIAIIILLAAGGAYALKKHVALVPRPVPDTSYVPTVPDTVKADSVLLNVPFTSQAPTGNWADPRQENGCEEASILMASLWIKNQAITPQDAEKAIIAITDYEAAHGTYTPDMSAADTASLMRNYFNVQKVSVVINPSIEDIKNELRQGRLVLAPANGQKLNNPHYKQPGPTTHMLVIKGFNGTLGQFITNDPGTQYGKSYVYPYQTVFNAMVDYPTGDHLSQVGRPKAIIVIEK